MGIFGTRGTPEPVAADIASFAADMVRPGFLTYDEVLELVRDRAVDQRDLPDKTIAKLVRRAWRDRAAELARDPSGPDSYRPLAAAFAELEARGVLCRMDFTCCVNCGHLEINDEQGADQARGYVFFHQQDSERIADGRLYLAFGSFDNDKIGTEHERLIGQEAQDVLATHGLAVTWDGSAESRIEVAIDGWRKPLPPD